MKSCNELKKVQFFSPSLFLISPDPGLGIINYEEL
jgi:hypothetical protein